jgi:hypothetical protein
LEVRAGGKKKGQGMHLNVSVGKDRGGRDVFAVFSKNKAK